LLIYLKIVDMETNFVQKTHGIILEKLNDLLLALNKAKRRYEQMASTINNLQLRYTILGLAQESKQYANELMSQIEVLGGNSSKSHGGSDFNYDGLSDNKAGEIEKEQLKDCSISEDSLIQLYRKVLNEPLLYEMIRKMLRYQLNGIMHSFSKLKLLNASLHQG
jgi:Domain of unknown function (DUF2383)